MTTKPPILIGIAGGSGSGKTYLGRYVQGRVGPDHVGLLCMDQYFRSLTPEEKKLDPRDINFDHPEHIDLELFVEHLKTLKAGHDINAPEYDFLSQTQTPNARPVAARRVTIAEGLFLLREPMRSLFDLTIFLEVDADQRLIGRLLRDIEEREHSIRWNIDRYQRFVRPSYSTYIAPTRNHADLVVDFTYRRVFFQEMLTQLIHDYVHNGFDFQNVVERVRSDGFHPGLMQEGMPPLSERRHEPLVWAADNPTDTGPGSVK